MVLLGREKWTSVASRFLASRFLASRFLKSSAFLRVWFLSSALQEDFARVAPHG